MSGIFDLIIFYTFSAFINFVLTILLIFQRKDTSEKVGSWLGNEGHLCSVLHGDLHPSERDRIIESFRNGEIKVLIASNVLSRGLDIEQVNVVINFDIPVDADGYPDTETYLHRIGRTGRFGRSGVSINFVHDKSSLNKMNSIVNYFKKPIARIDVQSIPMLEARLNEVLEL